jgi:hypothetical protein
VGTWGGQTGEDDGAKGRADIKRGYHRGSRPSIIFYYSISIQRELISELAISKQR